MSTIPKASVATWLLNNQLTDVSMVNSGYCEEFAKAFIGLFPGGEIVGTDNFVDFAGIDWPGGHIWIFADGKHYDCDALDGVDEWRQLPFFKNNLGVHQ